MPVAGHQRLKLASAHARSRIAVTPMPPAVQAEAMPRFAIARSSASSLVSTRENARAGGGKWVSDRDAAALDVELGLRR